MKLREEEFYEQYHQHGGTTIIPTEIFNELYDDAIEEIERLNNIINELEQWLNDLTILKTDKNGEVRFYDMVRIQAVLNKLQELKGSEKE